MKKVLIIITSFKRDEFNENWRLTPLKVGERPIYWSFKDKIKIPYYNYTKSVKERRLIVINGKELQNINENKKIENFRSKANNNIKELKNYVKDYYNSNPAMFYLMLFLKEQVRSVNIDKDSKITVGIHWNGDKDFYLKVNKALDKKVLNKLGKNTKEKIRYPTKNTFYFNYTIGGDRSILPQVREMVKAIQNSSDEVFNKAFDNLWLAIRCVHEICFFMIQLLVLLKLKIYDLEEETKEKEKEKILNSFKYLCKGKENKLLMEGTKDIISDKNYNLQDCILSDYGKEVQQKMDGYLNRLKIILNGKTEKEEFMEFCSKFRNFIVSVYMGKNPLENAL